jgi:predicted small secreted protein
MSRPSVWLPACNHVPGVGDDLKGAANATERAITGGAPWG